MNDPQGNIGRAIESYMATPSHSNSWQSVTERDIAVLESKETEYAGSWLRRGGVGAYMMLARKWDRLEAAVKRHGWDLFAATAGDLREEGVLDDLGDLRRYLLLVEGFVRSHVADPVRASLNYAFADHDAAHQRIQDQQRELDSKDEEISELTNDCRVRGDLLLEALHVIRQLKAADDNAHMPLAVVHQREVIAQIEAIVLPPEARGR